MAIRPARHLAAALAAIMFSGPVVAAERSLEQVVALSAVDLGHETPHTKWARPYARGPIRVLFVVRLDANVNIAATRDVIELVQRFDIAADVVLVLPAKGEAYAVTFRGTSGVYGGEPAEQRLARLLDDRYDCYVVDHEIAGHLPAEALQTVLGHVRAGAGLVLPQLEGYRSIDEQVDIGATPLADLPPALSGLSAEALGLGAGRIVSCTPPYRRFFTDDARCRIFGVDVPRDMHFEAYGRAILWAAGREPQLQLAVSVGGTEIPREQLTDRHLVVNWAGDPPDDSLRVETRIRSLGRGAQALGEVPARGEGRGRIHHTMPALPAGSYFVQVLARSDRGLEAWAVQPFEVTSGERAGSMRFAREWSEPGEPIVGTIAVSTPHRDERTLRMQVIDRHGRVLARQDHRVAQETVAFSLPTDASMPAYVAIEAVLADGDRPISHAYETHTIVRRGRDDFNFTLWGRLYALRYADIAEDLLARSGITSRIETSEVPWVSMTRAGMSYTPYCVGGLQRQHWRTPRRMDRGRKYRIDLDDSGVLAGIGEGGCWNDEPTVARNLRAWLGKERDYRAHGVLAYSMGDEMETVGSCLHPACLAAYRSYLQRVYGTVEALNASWGTRFADFDAVGLSAPDDNDEKQAFAQQNHARWYDRRAFQAWNFAGYVARFGRAARAMDPRAAWGVEGTGWLDDDLDAIVRHSNWWVPYSIPAAEVIRSIAPKGYLFGHFVGYTDSNPYYGMSDFWLSFLRGGNCIAWWRIDNFLAPHFGLSDGSRELVRSARVVFDGLGKLLNVESDMQHDGIVMLHSHASSQAASFIEPGPSYGTWSGFVTNGETEADKHGPDHVIDWALKPRGKSHMLWHRAIRAVGLQFAYVTDRMMRRDAFRPDAYKVLILAQCEALGAREAQVVRRFVDGGGTVIADVRPGLYDGHCKARSGGALDDVFGVRHTGNVPAVEVDGSVSGAVGDRGIDVSLAGLHVNPAVELTTGTPLGRAGKTPIVIVNRMGRGRAILLNFTMATYPNLSRPEAPESAATMLAAMFAEAGVQWPLRLLDADGARRRNVEAVRWRTGAGCEVVAVYGPLDDGRAQWRPRERVVQRARAADVPWPVRLELPVARHVQQIGSSGSIGPTRDFAFEIRPWRPTFIVLSDRKIAAPVLEPAESIARRGRTLHLRASLPDAGGLHALKVRVTTPDGGPARWFDRSVVVRPGGGGVDLPIALNEQPGAWQVEATDLYTGRAAVARFTVRSSR